VSATATSHRHRCRPPLPRVVAAAGRRSELPRPLAAVASCRRRRPLPRVAAAARRRYSDPITLDSTTQGRSMAGGSQEDETTTRFAVPSSHPIPLLVPVVHDHGNFVGDIGTEGQQITQV